MAIQVTLFDYNTFADIQNQNQPFSSVENEQDIVFVNLDTNLSNLSYLKNSVYFSITSFRIRTECKLLNKFYFIFYIIPLKINFFIYFIFIVEISTDLTTTSSNLGIRAK